MSDSNDGFKTLFTFLAGAAIGAIAGALMAPKSGKELRGDVKSTRTNSRKTRRPSMTGQARTRKKWLKMRRPSMAG